MATVGIGASELKHFQPTSVEARESSHQPTQSPETKIVVDLCSTHSPDEQQEVPVEKNTQENTLCLYLHFRRELLPDSLRPDERKNFRKP